jgi:hypothetical protein
MNKILVCALLLGAAAAASDDPNALFEKAQKAGAKRDYDKAIALLLKADAAWEVSSPQAPARAQALELAAILMRAHTFEKASHGTFHGLDAGLGSWRTQAAPVTQRAVALCEANPSARAADLALALELQADILGRKQEGAPFWDRATKIRAHLVSGIEDIPRPPAAAPPGAVIERIEPGVAAPVPLVKREPQYSEPARLMRYQGSALFSLIIDAKAFPRPFSSCADSAMASTNKAPAPSVLGASGPRPGTASPLQSKPISK